MVVTAGVSSTYEVLLQVDGREHRLRCTITRAEVPLVIGDRLEIRTVGGAAGEEVVFCRNLSRPAVLVDRINYEANRITLWVVIALIFLFALAVRLFALWPGVAHPGQPL